MIITLRYKVFFTIGCIVDSEVRRRNGTSLGGRHHFNRFIKRHSVKRIILRENDLIQSNTDIKNPNKPSERAKKRMNGAKIAQGVKTYT